MNSRRIGGERGTLPLFSKRRIIREETMIHTLIFDIGNVLADFNWRRYLDSWKLPQKEHEVVEQDRKSVV